MASANRELIHLECSECHERNYTTSKNRKKASEKLALKKFCSACRKHQEHKETKVK